MHVADSQKDFADVEHGYVVAKATVFPKTIKKLSTGAELEDHVDEDIILEGGFKRVDKGMVQLT